MSGRGVVGADRRPAGVVILTAFFIAGVLMSATSGVLLLYPGSPLEPMWRLNPGARAAFASMGAWSVVLLATVAAACGGAAYGLWHRRRWGWRLAVGLIGTNLIADLLNAVLRSDRRTLIGLPIGGAILVYLRSARPLFRGERRG